MGACDCIITKVNRIEQNKPNPKPYKSIYSRFSFTLVTIFLRKKPRLNVPTWLVQAGPGTIAESMIRGLPIILNGYIAGQVSSTLKLPFLCWVQVFQFFGFDFERRRQGMCRTWWKTDVGNSQNHQKRYQRL